MTKRSVIIGLLAAIGFAAYGQYACKYVPGTWGLVRGHLPTSVFGVLIVFAMGINPLLGKIHASLRLKPKEMAVILGLLLVSCGVIEAGMMRYFPRQLMTPMQQEKTHPGWQETEVLKYTPPSLLVNGGEYDEDLADKFFTAMGEPGNVVPIKEVPWHAWWKPLLTWTTLITLFLVANIALGVLVHRQWAEKERIRYPLAEIASSLLKENEDGRPVILWNRLFWIGFAFPFFIRIINGISAYTDAGFNIPLDFDFSALSGAFPELMKTPGASWFAKPTIFPTCIGMAFLLASDIGLSIGLANIFSVAVMFVLVNTGVNLQGSDIQGGYLGWQTFGAFVAMAVMVIYTGRRYYWLTAKEAVTFKRQDETQPAGVWAFRTFLICSVAFTVMLTAVGMDGPIALLSWVFMIVMVVVCARMNAECGTFFFSPAWRLPGIMMGLFGMTVLGPKVIIILGMLLYLVQIDVFECMMPFVVNGLKVSTDAASKVGRTGLLFGVGLLLAVVVTVPLAVWADHNNAAAVRRGGDGSEIWDTAKQSVTELSLAGQLDDSLDDSSWDRLAKMKPDRKFMVAVGVGFVLLIGISALRLRYSWWPIHPVMVLIFGTRFAGRFGFSFFLGWLIKQAVTKFGGGQKYTEMKPLMIGIIIGDLAGGFGMMAVSWIYYAVTGAAGRNLVLW